MIEDVITSHYNQTMCKLVNRQHTNVQMMQRPLSKSIFVFNWLELIWPNEIPVIFPG